MGGFFLGFTFCISDWLELGLTGWLAVAALLMLGCGGLALAIGPGRAAVLLVTAWVAAAVTQLVATDADDFGATIGVPFLLTFGTMWAVRGRRLATLARSAPLLLPVTLTVLLIPLFTAEVWQAATALHAGHLALAAALTIVPLAALLAARVRPELTAILRDVIDTTADSATLPDEAADRVVRRVTEAHREEEGPRVRDQLEEVYAAGFSSRVRLTLADRMIKSLERTALWRLVTTAAGLTMVVAAYLYTLAWILVQREVATKWTEQPIPTYEVDLGVAAVSVPGGPYIAVAALLGVVATAVFVSFAVTDERYAGDLSSALVKTPLPTAVAVALPYTVLREEHGTLPTAASERAAPKSTKD